MGTVVRQKGALGVMLFIGIISCTLFSSKTTEAATGINPQVNFQGRLLNAQGATVPDGFYNVQFKIYQDGDGQSAGNSTGSPAGSLKWTENYLNNNSQGVMVKNGFMSVQLGSVNAFGGSIDWDQDTLWLSMNIGGTNPTCTPFSSCSPDGEMLPMKRLSSTPYALNTKYLGGFNSSQFVQLGIGVQTDSTNNSSIYINKTGSGNLVTMQSSGADVFALTGGGDVIFGANANHTVSVATAGAGVAGKSLTLTAGNGGSGTTAGGDLILTAGAGSGGGSSGKVIIKSNTTNSATAFEVQNTSGLPELTVDTSANKVTLGNVTTTGGQGIQGLLVFADGTADGFGVSLQTNGAVTASRLIYLPDEAGTICLRNSSNCGFVSGSGSANFINNSSTLQNNANFYIRSNGNTVTGVLEASNGQTADILNINTYNGTSSTTVAKFTANGSLAITNSSTSALSVNNSSSHSVFGVNTSASQVLLGQSNQLNGALVFNNSSSANSIIINSNAAASSYTLTLPSTAPAPGLCLETSQADATQLVFVSCTNNNASIQKVTQWDANNTNTVNISPSNIGNEIVMTTQIPTGGVTVSSVSGGGVTTWTKAVVNNGNGTVNRVEMWVGTVTATGSSTITLTYSASPGANEITATEFTAAGANASTSWGITSAASQLNSSASTTVTYPNITSVNGSELYIGYAQVQNPPATAGSTTGFSYLQTSTQHNMITYNTSTTANTAYQPTANQNSSGQSNTVAAILTAFVSSTSINNTTSLQKANFYVQAATSGTVAGILQAASSGSANILDLRDSSGTNVLTVGNTGNLTLKPSTSTTAMQIQNSSGNNILTVDTSNNRTVLGSSSAVAGLLTFNNPGNANTISISAPTTVAASYTLSLPTDTPTAGLCLGTSPSNANQLIFASCATQVSAASISYVNQWSNNGTSITTLSDSPATIGNLLVLYSHATNNVSITGVSGGGVTNWTKVTSNVGGAGQGNNEMWRGVVTSTGSSTITVTYSSAAGANEIVAQEYTMGGTGGGTWAIDTSGTTTGSSTTVNYPSLTPANSSELYTGYAWGANTMSAGSSSGFTYVSTSDSKYTAYNTSVTGGSAIQPTASQNTSGNYNSIAALIQAYAGTSVIVNGTAAQQANFNVQAAISGTVAGVVQGASSGSADIFQAKNGSGNTVAAINATDGLTLGASGVVGGILRFAASGNSNFISLVAPTTPGSSYSLTLPSTTPAAGQCLATDPNDAVKLVFSSCANQVTSVAITFVNNWSATSATTLGVSPATIGNLMVFFASPSNGTNVTSVSGGGVTTWSKVTGTTLGSGAGTSAIDMWRGIVTSTGSSNITVAFAGGSGNPTEVAAMEFTTGSASGSWVVDASATQINTTGTTVTYPSLTPQSTKDLYVGYAAGASNVSAGSTSGFTYIAGNNATRQGIYNNNVSAGVSPTSTQASSGRSIAIGALIAAYSSSSVIANSTVTQQANFNIQAAITDSVAGTLQSNGTGDALQILDNSGTLVGGFSSTGNLLIKPSTASASAFRVQTTGSANVLSVDTNGKQVVVGAGSAGESSPSLLVVSNQTGSSSDPSVVNGAMYYNATTHNFRCGVAGAWQNCYGLFYSNTSASSAVNNCSNNCGAFSTAAAVPANYCQAGRVIKLNASGYFSSTGSATNLQFGVYYGTDSANASNNVLIGTLPPAASVTSASNNYFQINFNVICFSTSSMQAGGALDIQITTAGAGLTALPMGSTTGSTVVTSSAKNLYIFPIWGSASSSNTATLTQFTATTD